MRDKEKLATIRWIIEDMKSTFGKSGFEIRPAHFESILKIEKILSED